MYQYYLQETYGFPLVFIAFKCPKHSSAHSNVLSYINFPLATPHGLDFLRPPPGPSAVPWGPRPLWVPHSPAAPTNGGGAWNQAWSMA